MCAVLIKIGIANYLLSILSYVSLYNIRLKKLSLSLEIGFVVLLQISPPDCIDLLNIDHTWSSIATTINSFNNKSFISE